MRKPQARRHSAGADSRVLDSDRARTDVRKTLLEPQERSLEPMIGTCRDDDGHEQRRRGSHQAGERSMSGWHTEHQYEQSMKDIEPVADAAEIHERPNDWSTTWRHLQTQCSNEQSHTGGGDSREGYERLDSNDISEAAGCCQDAATARRGSRERS